MNKLFLAFIIFYFVFNLTTPVYAHETDIQAVESAASAALQSNSIINLNFSSFFEFVKLGLEHIYTGYDHILFLLAVILVISNLRQALKTVTAFTLAHSLTLILSSFGLVNLTSAIVEPIIALSIAYVAFENLINRERSRIGRRRWAVAFGFGLIHGMGFAGALSQINIPKNELLLDLVSFNVGIEIGQLSILAVVFPTLYFLNRFSWKSRTISFLSIAIGGIGFFWFLERVGFLNILSGISLDTLFQSISLLVIFFTFILVQAGILQKFILQPKLSKAARGVLILVLTILITVSFIPGILKPKEVHAAVPAGVIVGWAGTAASIPSGWTRVTALDARFVKQIATSTTAPGATGGAATHDHPFPAHSHPGASHSHGNPATASAPTDQAPQNNYGGPNGGMAGAHSHATTIVSAATTTTGASTSPANFDNATSEPPYVEVIFIQSDGSPAGLPSNAVAWFNGTAPTGWTAYAVGANRFWKGAVAAGNGGGTGGTSDAHGHTSVGHTHPSGGTHVHGSSANTNAANSGDAAGPAGPAGNSSRADHGHTMNDTGTASPSFNSTVASTTANGDGRPPWHKLLPVQNTSGSASLPNNVIVMWAGALASIPSSYKLSDGTSGTPNLSVGKFVNGAASSGEVGTTGGASTHTHATGAQHSHTVVAHSHTMPASTNTYLAVNTYYTEESQTTTIGSHQHTMGGSTSTDGSGSTGTAEAAATANTSNDPLFTGVAYIQFQNATPNTPTIMGLSPIPGSKPNKDGGNISLQVTATDPDVADTVQVEWDYSANSGGVWTNIGTTTLGAQGTQTLSWNASGLTPGSTYRLRARTKDNGGAISGYTTQIADWTLTSGCSPPVGGDLIISVSCAFVETVDGVDAGNITINTSVTLTINASQTVAFNSAKSITVNGSIAVNSTGQIKQTNLWMVDSDVDGWPASTTQTAQDSSPGGTYRRRNVLQSQTIIDCNDAVSSSTNSC